MWKFKLSLFVALMACFMISCESESENISTSEDIPEEFLADLNRLGFSTDGVTTFEDGYLVEGDIYLTEETIKELGPQNFLQLEQYSTNNLVTAVPRVITVYMPTGRRGLSSGEQAGLDEAIL